MTDKVTKTDILEREIVPAKPQPEDSFLTIFQVSTEKGYEPAFIEKMMELQERNDANNARKAFHEAMAEFKANAPDIEKDKTVSYSVQGKGTTTYNHASLANVTNKINKALSEYGLSAAWITSQGEGGITVKCTITHKLGHSESTALTAAPDSSGGKNAIQAIGSSVTYLERYTLLALTGLATHEMDDDGKGAEDVAYITEAQVKELQKEIDERGVDKALFLTYMATTLEVETVESLEMIPAAKFSVAKAAVISKKKPGREPGQEG